MFTFRRLRRRDPKTTQNVKPGTIRRVLLFGFLYSRLLTAFLVVIIIAATVTTANPLVYRLIIDRGILKGDAALIVRLAIVLAVLALADAILGILQSYLSSKINAEIVISLRSRLFSHIQHMPLAFFTYAQTGALVTRLNDDVNGARSAFTDCLSNIVGNLIVVVLTLTAMTVLSWRITLGALIVLPIFVLSARFWGRKVQEISRERYELMTGMNIILVEHFNAAGALLTKLFGFIAEESKSFDKTATKVSEIGIRQALYGRLFFTPLTLVAGFVSAAVYGWGGVLVSKHALNVGTVIALVSYLSRLYYPLLDLSYAQVAIMASLVSFERVFEILDLPEKIRDRRDAVTIPPGPLTISFDRVAFRYPRAADVSLASLMTSEKLAGEINPLVLREISFEVKAGQLLALVGPSGAGKTTITHLLPRLYEVESGSIKINGVDVRDAKLNSLRERIGVVTQDPHFFHDTIRSNLSYGKPGATDQQIWRALRDAQIFNLIYSLPDQLGTVVGERGYRFSGGEKQRLAIARLLLRNPDVVILDEATAHLDSESEAAVQAAFENVLSARTSIVIAHRLSTILKANQILVIRDGMIVQRGNHAELISRRGPYADLYQRQFASPVSLG